MNQKNEGQVLLKVMAYLEEHGPTNTRRIARALKFPTKLVRKVLTEEIEQIGEDDFHDGL